MDGWEASASILEVNGKSYTRPELLAYWIKEREIIRRLKEHNEPKPWTDDSVFERTYFCNVHREDDKVTRWIRRNYTPSIYGDFYEPAIVAARIFNNPDTLEQFKFKWFPVNQSNLIAELQEWGASNKTWGGAYVITTHGQKMPKVDYCVGVLQEAEDLLPLSKHNVTPLCYDYWNLIQAIDGLGSFLAAQVVADLKNTASHVLSDAEDWWAFSAPGPGSLRGLSWFHERKISPSTYRVAISEVWSYLKKDQDIPRMCMQDLQNCLCEYDKYCRVLTGTGRSKRIYRG